MVILNVELSKWRWKSERKVFLQVSIDRRGPPVSYNYNNNTTHVTTLSSPRSLEGALISHLSHLCPQPHNMTGNISGTVSLLCFATPQQGGHTILHRRREKNKKLWRVNEGSWNNRGQHDLWISGAGEGSTGRIIKGVECDMFRVH